MRHGRFEDLSMNDVTPASAKYATDIDPFSRASLLDPYADYATLHDIGPLAYLTRYNTWFATRYAAVRRVLGEPAVFSSARGIGFNDALNEAWAGMLPTLDPPAHTPQRKVYNDVLMPKMIGQHKAGIEAEAERCVEQMLEKREFDGAKEYANTYPVAVMADLIGFPDDERRQHLVHWATQSYNCCGPLGSDAEDQSSWDDMGKLYRYATDIVQARSVLPGSFAAHALHAMDQGLIDEAAAIGIVSGYATAGLDTTANAVAAVLLLFAEHPEQWDLLRALSAIRECLRLESPAQWFTRVTMAEVDFDGIRIPAQTRTLHSYGAANRDERVFDEPATMDITRNPMKALTWGYGTHVCPGQFISVMETGALLGAMVRRIKRIELTTRPQRQLHNLARVVAELPLRVTPA
jgi:cytochrome P450